MSGCSATGVLNALVPSSTYRLRERVPYAGAASLPRQVLDIYSPVQSSPTPIAARPPLVVFFYGGNWRSGERADYRFVGEALASGGALVLVPDYRLYPEVRYPVFLEDCALAMRWAMDQAQALGADPARIYLMGHSAGAYNAAMLALDPRWLGARREQLAGFIGLAGPYDFLPIINPDTQRAFSWPDTPQASQPIVHVSARAPRSLLLAASDDELVNPQRNTLGLATSLKAAGVDVRAQVLERVGHASLIGAVASPLRWLAPVREEVLSFVGLAKP